MGIQNALSVHYDGFLLSLRSQLSVTSSRLRFFEPSIPQLMSVFREAYFFVLDLMKTNFCSCVPILLHKTMWHDDATVFIATIFLGLTPYVVFLWGRYALDLFTGI